MQEEKKMSTPIYLIKSKKVTDLLVKELKRKNKFIDNVVKDFKKWNENIATLAYRDDPWDNSVHPYGVVFKDDFKVDRNIWKVNRDKIIYEGKYRKVYTPKKNTNEAKKIHGEFWKIAKSDKFFQKEEILKPLKYNPKSKTEDITHNKIIITTFRPGYKKTGKEYQFIFGGYEGYVPPPGVKEMLMSEYNKMFKSRKNE